MSEYRYYEFRALERPLTEAEMSELRAISSRAEITSTSFVNEYKWGDLKASPRQLVADYFDAYLHIANYDMRELMVRLPKGSLDLQAARAYETDECLEIWETDEHIVVSYAPYMEDIGGESWWEDQHLLGAIAGIRQQLMARDFRCLYLGWLFPAVYQWLDPEEEQPPVPAGLGALDGPLTALAQFLSLERHHLEAAAEGSLSPSPTPTDEQLRQWIGEQRPSLKDQWLIDVVAGRGDKVRAAIRREYADASGLLLAGQPGSAGSTAGEICERAETLRREREAREQEMRQRREEKERRERERRRKAYLEALVGREADLWASVDEYVATYKPKDYDRAVEALIDLRDLAEHQGASDRFAEHFADFVEQYGRRSSLMTRLDEAGFSV